MIVSFLVRSIKGSLIAKMLKKVGSPAIRLTDVIKMSKSYELVVSIRDALTSSVSSSRALAFLNRLCRIASRSNMLSSKAYDLSRMVERPFQLITSPWALPLGMLFFFWLSLVRVSPNTILLLYSVVISISIAIAIASREEGLRVADTRSLVLLTGLLMFIIGYAAFVIQISRVGGLPLLNDELRKGLSPLLNYLAWTTVPGTAFLLSSLDLRRCSAYALTVVGFLPSFFLAFRTEMIAYLLAVMVVLYHKELIGKAHIILGLILAGVFFVGVGAIRSVTTGLVQDPILSVLYRPTITVAALDTIVRLYGLRPVTGGWVHLAALSSLGLIRGTRYGPRTLISIYTRGRRTVSTTATLVGGPLLDWGLLGALIVPFIIAYLMTLSYKISAQGKHLLGPYAVFYAYTLVGIETGILDINIYGYLLISSIIVILSLRAGNEQD